MRDGDEVRFYYRGWKPNTSGQGGDRKTAVTERQLACPAVSKDGITFTKPKLGLIEFDGSKDNNIIVDHPSHNFTPFIDTRPGVSADERYEALQTQRSTSGLGGGLAAYASADGIHWRVVSEKPVITKGAFDSQNVGFWDPEIGKYRAYIRDFHDNLRDIRLAYIKDRIFYCQEF